MTRISNRNAADRHGLRRNVVSIETRADDVLTSTVLLECGHHVPFKGLPNPKRLRCPVCREAPWPPVIPDQVRDIWVTKWVLRDGKIRRYANAVIGSMRSGGHDHVRCAIVRVGEVRERFFRGEWHESLPAALEHADAVRAKALESLAKHADYLASIVFTEAKCADASEASSLSG